MPTIYRSTDASAPVLDNTAGSLISLLDACLVNGYGSQTAAGWSKPYTGTNKAVYQSSGAGSTGAHFRLDDSTGGSAYIRAYSSMTDVDTGSDAAPSVSEKASGGRLFKAGSATAVPWIIIADSATAWLSFNDTNLFGFGDINSFIPVDPGRYFVASGADAISGDRNSSVALAGFEGFQTGTTDTRGLYLGLDESLTAASQRFSVPCLGSGDVPAGVPDNATNDYGIGGATIAHIPYPDNITNRLSLHPALVGHSGILRGHLRGVYCPLNRVAGNISNGTVISSESWLPAGSSLIFLNAYRPNSSGANQAMLAIETGLDW